MKLDIRADEQSLAAFLRDYVGRRLHARLDRFGPDITRLAVDVSDANGPRGGVDKHCRITAHLAGLGDVCAESIDSEAQVAIDRTVARIERAIARAIVRARGRNDDTVRGRSGEMAEGW